MVKGYSVFHIEQKKEFNCFFVNFLRYSFGRKKAISTVIEREYTPDITRQVCFAYELTSVYMIKRFTERYFITDYSYILENRFYFRKSLLFILVLFCLFDYGGPSIHLFRTSWLCTFIIYRKKEIGFVAKFFSKYLFGPKVIPNYISSYVPRSRNQVKLSINKTAVVRQI